MKFSKKKPQWDTISYDDNILQEVANLTDEQMLLIKMAMQGSLDNYIQIKKELDESTDVIYKILVDRDWLYDNGKLKSFINNSKLLSSETDL